MNPGEPLITPPQVRALLFDADGVLQTTGASFRASLEALAPGVDLDTLVRAVMQAELACLPGRVDFAHCVAPVLKRFGLAASPADFFAIWHDIELDYAMLRAIAEFRAQGIACYLCSNQQTYRARHMSRELGLSNHFDREFYSCDVGAAKPSAKYFMRVLRSIELHPEETVFIDDIAANVNAASALGILGVLFPRNAGAEVLHTLLHPYLALVAGAKPA
ncbi:MAG: HAD-IA family hydrolase [Burkholderiaceae bacterium]|jgi:putative hydrolase of the HAD superfamily